jgi:NAD(P)-dependent dehydrogenase (short-subunit alcohol dehydrogenase family)
MSNLLEGKLAVVTGGTSGIGLGIAKRFVSEGACVYITGRRQSQLDSAVAEIGDRATGVRGDASSLADLDALYERIGREQGHIDVLVANAGIAESRRSGLSPKSTSTKLSMSTSKASCSRCRKPCRCYPVVHR